VAQPVGIDLGTTNSVVCVWHPNGPETIPIDGQTTMPSVLARQPDGKYLVGHAAKSRSRIDPQNAVVSSKRWMGDPDMRWHLGPDEFSPVDVAARILERLRLGAEQWLKQPVREAVITTPAYFNNNQKRDTRLAAEAAGLTVLQMLPEPTAAAISYGLDKGKDQTIVVYDLGGGTFDVTVLRVLSNRFEVIAVDGDARLGGDDLDRALAAVLASRVPLKDAATLDLLKQFVSREGASGSQDFPVEVRTAGQLLLQAASAAKHELAETDRTVVSMPEILGVSLETEVTLAKYNSLIQPFIDRTVQLIGSVLKSARMRAGDIDRVVLCGGSCRNKLVRKMVTNAIKEPWMADRLDQAVAQGAAIMAGYLNLPTASNLPIEVVNVTPHTLGIRATKDAEHDSFKPVIAKNTRIPHTAVSTFSTFRDYQKTVSIDVFQGDHPLCRDNVFIGGFLLEGIPGARAGEPNITVEFRMDGSDLLHVTARCQTAQTAQSLDVNLVSSQDQFQQQTAATDIMFLIDTSGSMSSELSAVKEQCQAFADQVEAAGIDCRVGLMDFDKPSGGPYKWEIFPPTNAVQLKAAIGGLRIGRLGGVGCYVGAADTIPVMSAFAESFPSADRTRMGVLISDEVGNDAASIKTILDILTSHNICMHAVGVAGSCHQRITETTGGSFWNIATTQGRVDLTEVLKSIAAEITHLVQRDS